MIIRLLIISMLFVTAITDIKTKEIRGWELGACFLLAVISASVGVFSGGLSLAECFLSVVPGSIMLAVGWLTKEQIGYGDGLLILAIGLGFGIYSTALGLVLAFFLSGVCAVVLLIAGRGRKARIPFVPFVLTGMVVSCFA